MKAFLRSVLLTGSLWLFALFIPIPFPMKVLAIGGLVLAAYWIYSILQQNPETLFHRGLWDWRSSRWTILISLLASIGLSMIYRSSITLPVIPTSLGLFVIVSVLIGGCEELVFRGIVQGEASRWNPVGAVALASFSHAGYKSLLFVLAAGQIDITIQKLFIATFLAGIGLGFTRYRTGSLWPCILAHGLFDFWVYAEAQVAPWWVW